MSTSGLAWCPWLSGPASSRTWRADHGNAVGWTVNTADTGVQATGDDVTAYGLFSEQYQKNEVIWSGQGGTDILFQNELPYDPPSAGGNYPR